MEKSQSQSAFMKSIHEFVENQKKPGSLVETVKTLFPDMMDSLEKQLETFEQDMAKLEEGKMSYSEMRSLYG